MPNDSENLAALIGSRICHDLISPIGAITNGLELLELSNTAPTPELSLVSQSAANASARLRFFRLAFGTASPDQIVSATEIKSLLSETHTDGRLSINFLVNQSHPRPIVQAMLLALLCAEQAVPFGGEIEIRDSSGKWTITARSKRIEVIEDHWKLLSGGGQSHGVSPAAVQFLMLPDILTIMHLKPVVQLSESKVIIQF